MNLRRLALPLVLLALSSAAHAQISAYGLFTAERFDGIHCVTGGCPEATGSNSPIGGTAGITYDVRTIGRVRLGVDVRGTIEKGSKNASSYFSSDYRAYSVLGGLRASFQTRVPLVRPYVQGSVGLGRNNGLGDNADFANRIQYGGFAGADIRLLPVVDFRAIEVGYGSIGGAGTGANNGSHSVLSISTGVVLHFPY